MADIAQMRQKFFDQRRGDIERQARGQQQEVGDAINRRFTSLGQSGSGAAINAQLKAREAVNAQANQARNELAGQELQGMYQEEALAEPGRNRAFQATEAEKQRGFASGEANLGRQFQEKMALGDQGFKRSLFDIEQGNKLKEMDLAERQFALDKDTTEFNRRMAEIEMNKKDPGLFQGLMGDGMGNAVNAGASFMTFGASDVLQGKAPLAGVANGLKSIGIGGGK